MNNYMTNTMMNLYNSFYYFSSHISEVLNSINPNITYFILKQKVYGDNLECISDRKIKIVSGSIYVNLNIVIIDSEIKYIYLNPITSGDNSVKLYFEKYFVLKNNNIHIYNLTIIDKLVLHLKTPNQYYFNIDYNNFITNEKYHLAPENIMKVIK